MRKTMDCSSTSAKWRLARDHQKVRDLLFPAMQLKKPEEEFTFLGVLLQTSKDTDPETLTSRMILMTAAAVSTGNILTPIAADLLNHEKFHNSPTATVQALYSLCTIPEYAEI